MDILNIILYALLPAIVIAIGFIFYKKKRDEKKYYIKKLNEAPLSHQYFLEGHPSLIPDHAYAIETANDKLQFVTRGNEIHGEIALSSITAMDLNDHSTSGEIDTPDDMNLFFFIFEMFLSSDKRNEVYRLTINWKDGETAHQTAFEYVGYCAEESAKIAYEALQDIVNGNGQKYQKLEENMII